MQILNLLSISIETANGFGTVTKLEWIGNIIDKLISGFNSIGVGIIMFTLILKLITLPLDIISRASMKKSSLKMEQMRPKLEKLQRQYANNKVLYNQKIQALYKQQGYSMAPSCLSMFVSLIIFFVVMGQFSTFSYVSEWRLYNNLSESYTQAIMDYDDSVVTKVDGQVYLNQNYVFENDESFSAAREVFNKTKSTENDYDATFEVKTDKMSELVAIIKTLKTREFVSIDFSEDPAVTNKHIILKEGQFVFNKEMFDESYTDLQINQNVSNEVMEKMFHNYLDDNVYSKARESAAQRYKEDAPSFLWIKNLWLADLPFKHPVYQNVEETSFASHGAIKDNVQFKEITANLSEEKGQPNGFFVLVLLSIGLMFLSQFISMKSQKSQLELQTNDGRGASTQKMMMWVMPIVFGVFSFMYSGAFSLYMTISTIFSTLSTLIINFFVEMIFKKKYGAN